MNCRQKISLIITGAAQVNLIMLASEIFKEFYTPTEHSSSAFYLFFGLHGHNALVPWMWSALAVNILATVVLSIPQLRRRTTILLTACVLLFASIYIEKGMGLIVPGFIPEAWGRIFEYSPSPIELTVTAGIWSLGAFLFTLLAKLAIPIQMGQVRCSSGFNASWGRKQVPGTSRRNRALLLGVLCSALSQVPGTFAPHLKYTRSSSHSC